MSRFFQVRSAIQSIQQIAYKEEPHFFEDAIVWRLEWLLELIRFPAITDANFQRYLGYFREEIAGDIRRCRNVHAGMSTEEKQALLESICQHAATKMQAVTLAFAWYVEHKNTTHISWPYVAGDLEE